MTVSVPPPPRGNKDAIAAAVLRVLSTGGADDLTVRKVAAEAGVSVGAVQHHFPTRAALIIGAMDAVNHLFMERIRSALSTATTPQERLSTFCDELACLGEAGRRDAVVWTAFASRAGTDSRVHDLHVDNWRRTEAFLQTLLADSYPNAQISGDDAALLLATLDGIAVARGAEGDHRMTSDRGRLIIAAVLATFAARSSSPAPETRGRSHDRPPTEIRPATPADAEAIAIVHAQSWRETYGRFVDDPDTNPWFDSERRIAMWRSSLDDDELNVVVAVTDGSLVGFAATHLTPGAEAARPEELHMLYVLESSHGSGAGQALLDAVLADRSATLWVAADNPRAHAFYRRNGFRPDGAESSFGPIPRTVRLVR